MTTRILLAAALCLFSMAARAQLNRESYVAHKTVGVEDRDLLAGVDVYELLTKNNALYAALDDARKSKVKQVLEAYVKAMREVAQRRKDSGKASKHDLRTYNLQLQWVFGPVKEDVVAVVNAAGRRQPNAPNTGDAFQQMLQNLHHDLVDLGMGAVIPIGEFQEVAPPEKTEIPGTMVLNAGPKPMEIKGYFKGDSDEWLDASSEGKVRAAMATQAARAKEMKAKGYAGIHHIDIRASCALFLAPGVDKDHFKNLARRRAEKIKKVALEVFNGLVDEKAITMQYDAVNPENPEYPGTGGKAPQQIADACKAGKSVPEGYICDSMTGKGRWRDPKAEDDYYGQFRYTTMFIFPYVLVETPPQIVSKPGKYRLLVMSTGGMKYYEKQ